MSSRFHTRSSRRQPCPRSAIGLTLALALLLPSGLSAGDSDKDAFPNVEALGEALFHDVDLSFNRTQSCATCHDPASGFVDPSRRATSLGANGETVGARNAPTVTYARFTPAFSLTADGIPTGGQFHDGRAGSLQDQAAGPPLNPAEMAMPSRAAVRERLLEKPAYITAFSRFYGGDALASDDRAYEVLTDAIARFEQTPAISPFDSKYDRYLRGEYQLTGPEELGMTLFFSKQFTNCNLCHQLRPLPAARDELFTNHQFFNIGVPANPELVAAKGGAFVDAGATDNPAGRDAAQRGKFKTPTLRNVAVTGPYMHNGVFRDLETVIRFYNSYNSIAEKSKINPETGKPWGPPEVDGTLAMAELETGPALDDRRVAALVAFLKTLTDARYEHLLK